MRLIRLQVSNFGCVKQGEVAFGPGLNVLFGPNDLGKSSLADAIRMGLLLPHTSASHTHFVGWRAADPPRVELVFETEAQRVWRVKKVFDGQRGKALLEFSKTERDFAKECRGRKVDAKIRELLGWGIPGPGGRGGKRGLPRSFLTTVLLGRQGEVSAALDANLEEDGDLSGKQRIADALEALGQDPLFAAVLDRTQTSVDRAFTTKGNKKRGKNDPFRVAADRVKRAQEEVDRRRKVVGRLARRGGGDPGSQRRPARAGG